MMKNYLMIALRTIRRHSGYAFVNIMGLAVGLCACLLIGLYVQDELSYDRFYPQAERIYRVVEDYRNDGGEVSHVASTPSRLAPALDAAFPAIETAARLYPHEALLYRDGEHAFQQDGFFFADSTFFDVFSIPFVHGDPATALDAPFSVVLTESAAQRYFSDADPLGQTLRLDGQYALTVTGVVADRPHNTHLQFEALAAYASLRDVARWVMSNWHYPPMYTYVRIAEGTAAHELEAQFAALEEAYFDAEEAA